MADFFLKRYNTCMSKQSFFLFFSLTAFLLSLFGYIIIVQHHSQLWNKFDLLAYYNAGRDVIEGRDVYLTGRTYFNFLYTPFSALLFSFMAMLTVESAKVLITILSLVAFVLSLWVTWGLLGYKNTPRLSATLLSSSLLLWTEPIQQTINFGQINLILLVVILLGFSGSKIWNGIGIGLATSIKLTPAIFIVYLLVTRRYQAAIAAVTVCLLTTIIGYLFLPTESQRYWSGVFMDTSRVGDVMLIGHQSLNGTISRLTGSIDTAKPYWYLAVTIVGILGISIASYVSKRGNEIYGLLLCAITGLLISPFSWSHHWVWIAVLFVFLIHQSIKYHSLPGWVTIFLLFIIFGWFTPVIPNLSSIPEGIVTQQAVSFSRFQEVQQNFYVVIGLLFLFISAAWIMYAKKK